MVDIDNPLDQNTLNDIYKAKREVIGDHLAASRQFVIGKLNEDGTVSTVVRKGEYGKIWVRQPGDNTGEAIQAVNTLLQPHEISFNRPVMVKKDRGELVIVGRSIESANYDAQFAVSPQQPIYREQYNVALIMPSYPLPSFFASYHGGMFGHNNVIYRVTDMPSSDFSGQVPGSDAISIKVELDPTTNTWYEITGGSFTFTSLRQAFKDGDLNTSVTAGRRIIGWIRLYDGQEAIELDDIMMAESMLVLIDDHGALNGLGDDDHIQYVFKSPVTSDRNLVIALADVVPLTVRGYATTPTEKILKIEEGTANTEVFSIGPAGRAIFQNFTDSTTGFQIFDKDGGTPILNVDTQNERIGIKTNIPTREFDVRGTKYQEYYTTSRFRIGNESFGYYQPTASGSGFPAMTYIGSYWDSTFDLNAGSYLSALYLDTFIQNTGIADIRNQIIASGHISTGSLREITDLYIDSTINSGGGSITDVFGIRIADKTVGSNNYSIYTGLGLVRFGDRLNLTATGLITPLQIPELSAPPSDEIANNIYLDNGTNYNYGHEQPGFRRYTGTEWEDIGFTIKNNFTAIIDPTVNDDIDLGYTIDSMWYNTVTTVMWLCYDNTDGAADWREITGIKHVVTKAGAAIPSWDANGSYWYPDPIRALKKEETGFPTTAQTVLDSTSFDKSTRTFTLALAGGESEFVFYYHGNRFVKTSGQSLIITDVEGEHYIYFNEAGILVENVNPGIAAQDDIYAEQVLVTIVYWDATNKKDIMLSEERHGFMPGVTHANLHRTRGTQYIEGLALGDFAIDESPVTDAGSQFSCGNGVILDEDLPTNITDGSPQDISPIIYIPIFYKDGANGYWRREWVTDTWQATTGYSTGDRIIADNSYWEVTTPGTSGGVEPTWSTEPYPGNTITGDGTVTWTNVGTPRSATKTYVGGSYRAAWNEWTGSTWTQTEVGNLQFVYAHIFATNDVRHPIIAIQGQSSYVNITDARNNANEAIDDIVTAGLPFVEWRPIGTIIYQTSQTYNNESFARTRSVDGSGTTYIDLRISEIGPGTGAIITSHNSLTGLQGGTAGEYYHLTATDDTNFDTLTDGSNADALHKHSAIGGITGNNWKTFYTNGSGVINELALGANGYVLTSNGASSAPSWQAPGGGATIYPHAPGGRLGLTSGVYNDTADVSGGTILYYVPGGGAGGLSVYDTGTSSWGELPFLSQFSISLAALTANTGYRVYYYNNGGAAALEVESYGTNTAYNISTASAADPCVIQYSHTTQAFAVGDNVCIQGIIGNMNAVLHCVTSVTAIATIVAGVTYSITVELDTTGLTYTSGGTVRLFKNTPPVLTTQDGFEVKSGDTSRFYIGDILIGGDGGESHMTLGRQFVANHYNKINRRVEAHYLTNNVTQTTTNYELPAVPNACKDGQGRVSFIAPHNGCNIDMVWATAIITVSGAGASIIMLQQNEIANNAAFQVDSEAAFAEQALDWIGVFAKMYRYNENPGYNYVQKIWSSGVPTQLWFGGVVSNQAFNFDTSGVIEL